MGVTGWRVALVAMVLLLAGWWPAHAQAATKKHHAPSAKAAKSGQAAAKSSKSAKSSARKTGGAKAQPAGHARAKTVHGAARVAVVPRRGLVRVAHVPASRVRAVEPLPAPGEPLALASNAAIVLDQDSDEVLFSKNPGAVLPIASLSKLMSALVVVNAHQPMDEPITLTPDDIDTEKMSRSRLAIGATLQRGELLHLALMASENRAAHALGRSYPGGLPAFVDAMNEQARVLGMKDTHFIEPTGLSSSNQSSARDLSLLVKAAYGHDTIRALSTSPSFEVEVGERRMRFANTNRLVSNPSWQIGLQKTGYISEAGRCLVMQAQMAGRRLIMVLLDSAGKYSRLGDAERIRRWVSNAHASVRSAPLTQAPSRPLAHRAT